MRLIDADRLQKQFNAKSSNPNYRVNMHNIKSIINNSPTVEAIPKADYEDRLRAEKIAMLEELRLEADKLKGPQYNVAYWVGFFAYDDFIKKKINALKEQDEDGND